MTATKPVNAEDEATPVEDAISTPTEDAAEASEVDETPSDEAGVGEAKPKRQNFSHANCDHEKTKAARAKCRKDRAKLAEAPNAEADEPAKV
jgi:hypothetical protein